MFSVMDKSDKSSTEPHKENIVQQHKKWKSIAAKDNKNYFINKFSPKSETENI